jgi:hypothetical protein
MSSSFLANDPILARISRHDRSFCSLIECIPRSLYRAVEEDEDVLNAKYFKHKRAPMTADERKMSRKQRRRETYGLGGEEGAAADKARSEGDDSEGGDDTNEGGKSAEIGNKKRKLDTEPNIIDKSTTGNTATFSTFDEGELLAAEGIESLKQRLKVGTSPVIICAIPEALTIWLHFLSILRRKSTSLSWVEEPGRPDSSLRGPRSPPPHRPRVSGRQLCTQKTRVV